MKHLPSVRVFSKRILDDIAEQRSVVVLLPATVDPDWMWSLLEDELWHREYRTETVDLPSLAIPHGLAAAIGETFHVSWPSSSTSKDLASLLCSEGLPDLILLNGVEHLEKQVQVAWIRFIDQWA